MQVEAGKLEQLTNYLDSGEVPQRLLGIESQVTFPSRFFGGSLRLTEYIDGKFAEISC